MRNRNVHKHIEGVSKLNLKKCQTRFRTCRPKSFWLVSVMLLMLAPVTSNPTSRPHVPFRTDPLDQEGVVHHNVEIPSSDIRRRSDINIYSSASGTSSKQRTGLASDECPLQFTLGLSRKSHASSSSTQDGGGAVRQEQVVEPPMIYPVFSSHGSGRQVVYTTLYEHLDLYSPSFVYNAQDSIIKEGLVQGEEFPLLFESSTFLASPLVHDVNGDGIVDATLVDYDGGIYMMGLYVNTKIDGDNDDSSTKKHFHRRRFFHRMQIPRLYVRREWLEARLNQTLPGYNGTNGDNEPHLAHGGGGDDAYYTMDETGHNFDPFHSYFEYGSTENKEGILRGVTANVLGQDHADLKGLEERRQRRVQHEKPAKDEGGEEGQGHRDAFEEDLFDVEHGGQEPKGQEENVHRRLEQQAQNENAAGENGNWIDDDYTLVQKAQDEAGEDQDEGGLYDKLEDLDEAEYHGDGDDYAYRGYDDYYGGRYANQQHNDYYDEKHYIRLPPHVLSAPVLADMKRAYATNPDNKEEREEMLFFAVSYYFDEDEYEGFFSYKRFDNVDEGDETETSRGYYVANAIMALILDTGSPGNSNSFRFGRQEHLDLSCDPTAPHNVTMMQQATIRFEPQKHGAFALAPPTVADIDGNEEEEVLMGTSMGMIYCLNARHMYAIEGWPLQVPNAIQSRILVEDVVGDTNLEIFVNDVAGNIYCFDHKGNLVWHRDLIDTIIPGTEIRAVSSMTMGDVNGDGNLDIVLIFKVLNGIQWSHFVVCISAATGEDIPNFPMQFDKPLPMDDGMGQLQIVVKLPQALLIDLHAEQDHWKPYLYRNGTAWEHPTDDDKKKKKKDHTPPHGGKAPGLHIVQPIGADVYIIEGGSGCTQKIAIGEEIEAMVQADDVHGTNNIDLVVSTKTGNIVTLESPAVPYHPLNVWNTGEVRSRRNQFAQGFSASQGIFVHSMSRRYRDIFGVYIPVTFEIFDNRPNIQNEPDRRVYTVEIRDGTSAKRAIFRKIYKEPGKYTERIFNGYGPGYYTLTILLRTTHGLIYEDSFHIGYNVHYLDGFGLILWLPLIVAMFPILICSRKRSSGNDDGDDEDDGSTRGNGQGILGVSS